MTPLGALLLGFVGGIGTFYVASIPLTMSWLEVRRRLINQDDFNRHIRRLQLVTDELGQAGFDAYSVPNVDNPHEQVRALREQRDNARRAAEGYARAGIEEGLWEEEECEDVLSWK